MFDYNFYVIFSIILSSVLQTTESSPIEEGESRMSVPPSMSSPESPEINYPPQVKGV